MNIKDIDFQPVVNYIKRHYLETIDITRAINQIIIVIAILVALREYPPRPIEIITVLIVTLLGIQITRIYASILSNKIKYKHNSKGITISDLKKELKAITGDLAKGLSIPIFFFALSVVRLISVEVAFVLTNNILLFVLFIYGYLAGRYSGENIFKSFIYGLGIITIGAVLVYIRTII